MLRHSIAVSTLLFVSYGIVFVFGIFGNGLLIATLVKTPSLRTTTNIFIGNLAIADLLVSIFCIPFILTSNVLLVWPFGAVLCKLVAYFQAIAVNASIYSLVAISIDKYLSVRRPFGLLRKRKLIVALSLIWFLPICYMVPWLFVFEAKSLNGKNKHTICADFWKSKKNSDAYFITVNLILSYLLPLVIITVCYLLIYKKIQSRNIPGEMCPNQKRIVNYKSKIKIIKMILIVIIIFTLSWFPLYMLFVSNKFLDYPDSSAEMKYFQFLFPLAQWLATSNAGINPIIYTCYSRTIRNELLKTMYFLKRNSTRQNCTYTRECITFSSTV